MFHVAHLLPFRPADDQQIERKRHIGNDIVILLYNESGMPFQFESIASKQNHVVLEIVPAQSSFMYGIAHIG